MDSQHPASAVQIEKPTIPSSAPKRTMFMLLAIIIALLATTSYLAFQNYQLRKIVGKPSTSPFPTSSPVSDQTTDWKTYTGKYFSLKHPIDLDVLSENNSKTELGNLIFKTVVLSIQSTNLTSIPTNASDSILDGKQAKKFLIEGTSTQDSVYKKGQYLVVQTIEEPLVEIRYSSGLGNPQEVDESIFNKILSTFKFIDSLDTSDWKTYINTPYLFSFMYPGTLSLDEHYPPSQKAQIILTSQESREIQITGAPDNHSDSYLDYPSTGKITINGITWNKYTLPKGYCDGPGCSPPILALTTINENRGLKYSFSVYAKDGKLNFTDLENKILASFKFTQ